MIDVTRDELAVIQGILKDHVPRCRVWAFGSRVTGQAKEYSDLDLVIIGKAPIGRLEMVRLKEAFEESKLRFRVDVLDWHALPGNFQKLVEESHEVVQ